MSLPQHRQEGLARSQSSLSSTHTHSNTHSDGDRALLLCLLFFSNLLHEKVYSALESHLADGRSAQERTIIVQGKYYCRPDLRLKVFPLSVFMIPGEVHPPLRNYHPHQSPWSSMATLSKHALRHSSHFHNNQHGTFRPEYIINKCTKWTHCWQVDGYSPVLFLDSYTVLSGACKYLAYNVMLVFKYIFNSFFVTCALGFKNDPLLTSVDKLTAYLKT